ncbi:MAG: hypothetical protein S4CHLAM2_13070 [Chlamydiales bacterium]|nr:hypothetical protein [Chlamydiales bacterium]
MEDLFSALPPFSLYQVGSLTPKGEGILSHATFLETYGDYVAHLKRGEIPSSLPAPVLSVTEEALEIVVVDEARQIYKPKLPIVQMQAHAFRYSPEDQTFRSQLFGVDAVTWGIQLGYPQIYADPQTHAIFETRTLPNGPLFRAIQKWVRRHTLPTPFWVEGKRQNVPIRLGKACFSWINAHPQLKQQGIEVVRTTDSSSVD